MRRPSWWARHAPRPYGELFQRGACLSQDSPLAGSLEDIDDPRKFPRFQRGSRIVSFAVLDDPIVRGDQFGLADPGRDDFRNDHITDRAEDFDRLITRQLSHDRYLSSARPLAALCTKSCPELAISVEYQSGSIFPAAA